MNLADLQSARSKERQRDSLQHLPDDFYENVGGFVEELKTERERAAEAAEDPFDAPEVRRLTDDIKTAENTVEAVYERRVGKLVKLASLDAAGMPTEKEGLTGEERDLFCTLVEAIEANRTHVLEDVLAGNRADRSASTGNDAGTALSDGSDTPSTDETGQTSTDPDPDADNGISAAEAMGADTPANDPSTTAHESPAEVDPSSDVETANERPTPAEPDDERGRTPAGTESTGGETVRETTPSTDSTADADSTDTDRTTVRITRDVGEIFGADERTYHLAAEDVVTLPEVNATPLLERDAAEHLR